MAKWLDGALAYLASWIEFQMRLSEQPGCILAVADGPRVVLEQAFGRADLRTGEALTPRHRFRVASHSKSFTAAGILLLHERGRLHLDDPVGRHVTGLHKLVAQATIGQLLSHSAGIVRDGPDAGQFSDRRPFLSAEELRADLRAAPAIVANTRFKYSNHGFGLLGLAIEAIAGEPYRGWIKREIVAAAGLQETEPDMPLPPGTPFARGHSGKLALGERLVIQGENPTHAIGPAGGFVSTAGDLVRFFGQLAPQARRSVLAPASRHEMTRRHWRNPHADQEGYYGLGIISGTLGGWPWFGHSGGLQGYISRTSVLPDHGLTLCVLTNATDGWAEFWMNGAIHILRAFATHGRPTRKVSDWTGRWWSVWGAFDLVPLGGAVLLANPHAGDPFASAAELAITGRDHGRIAVANGYQSHGEPVRRTRDAAGAVTELWLGGARLVAEAQLAIEMRERYGPTPTA